MRFTGTSQADNQGSTAKMETEETPNNEESGKEQMEMDEATDVKGTEQNNNRSDDEMNIRADDPAFNRTDEFDVYVITEGIKYVLRPIRRWKETIRQVSMQEITIQDAVLQTHFRLGVRAITGQEGATPDEGWSGYIALLQAKWMSEQRTKQDVMICADIRNKEFREELLSYMKKITNNHREIRIACEVLGRAGDKVEVLRADKQYKTTMELLPANAGHVAWFQREADTLWLLRTTMGDYEMGLTAQDIEKVLAAAKIGVTENRHYILSGPTVFIEGLAKVLEEHFNNIINNHSEAGKAAQRAQSGST